MPEQQIDIPARRDPAPPFRGAGDLAAALPGPVRKKFKALRAKAEKSVVARRAMLGKRDALRESIAKARDMIAELTLPTNALSLHGHGGHGLAEDSPQVRAEKAQLASALEDLADLDEYGKKNAGGEVDALVRNLEEFLERFAPASLQVVVTEVPTLKKGVSISEAIEARRRRLRELDADLRTVEQAPWPSSVTKQRARAQVEELAKRGRPDVFALVERCHPIEWPMLPVTQETIGLPPMIRVDSTALMAWALGPALVAAVEREIDEISDDAHAVTPEQREERRQQILADTLAAEREEEALIELAEAEGIAVSRRVDADPRAVLRLSGALRVPKKERIGAG